MIRRLAALALLCAAVPAQANYVFDPADLPPDFKCHRNDTVQECTGKSRFAAWHNRYGDRFAQWYFGYLFDTDRYFDDDPASEDEDLDRRAGPRVSPNLVDAVYSIALRRYGDGWAFAIAMVCPGGTGIDQRHTCAPRLRMISFRKSDEIDPARRAWLGDLLPTTKPEVAAELRLTAKWEEADLRTCKGAIDHLLAFPAQRGSKLWHPGYARWLRGKAPRRPDEIIVTTDGDGVYLRANGMGDPASSRIQSGFTQVVYNQANGGEGYDWAKRMAEVVRPCLKPASAPALWDRESPRITE